MGTAKREHKDKIDKSKKHKHKHEEKAAAAAAEQRTAEKSAKKQKKQEAEQARQAAAVEEAEAAVAAALAAAEAAPAAAAAAAPASDSSSDDDSDVEMQEAPAAAPASANTQPRKSSSAAAGAKTSGKSSGSGSGKSLLDVLQAEGLVQVQVSGAQCELDLRGIQNPEHKELWVLRLPDGVSVDALHGQNIHIPPGGLPAARHLRPPPNPFSDPRADLLSYVQSAVPSQEVGHVSIGADSALGTGNHQHRELQQAHEFEAMTYSIIAAVPPAAGGSSGSNGSNGSDPQLKLLKVGRFIHLASDTALVDKKRMRQVSNAGVEVWGAKDGWDCALLPRHKPRRRLGGWQVEGGRRLPGSSGSSGSNGDEEFEEVVFLQPGEEDDSPAVGDDSSDDIQQQQRQQGSAADELHPRFYSDDDSEDEEGSGAPWRQLQGQEEDRALPGGAQAPFMADLQQWLLSLPIEAKTYALQQQVAQQVSTEQWAADRRGWWAKPPQNQYLNPGNSAQQAQLLQKLAELKDKHSSSSRSSGRGSQGGSGSDSEDDSDDVRMTNQGYGAPNDVSPDDIVVVEELGAVEEDESSDDDGPAAAGSGSQLAGYPCPLPLTYIVTLPKEVEAALEGIRGVRLRQRLRNAAVLLFTDWREVWVQVDKDLLSDDELWQLVQALPLPLRQHIQAAPDRERLRRVQARRQAAKTLGQQMVTAQPGPRPTFTATDAGYAPYQATGERKVAGSNQGASTDAEDSAVAAWLLEQGASRRVKLLGASELRGRGLDWDTDPGSLGREGLHVVLPDGRDVHIPAGTDLDWQGELRRAWGFEGRGS